MKTKAEKRCFIISPIGGEGTDVRKHADNLYKYVIKPALDECGIKAFRSDHLTDPGKISTQMFDALMHEDLCIAVLTFFNPNVFYELAVAQASARPVIVMIEKGHELPFDIRDLRCVYYDFDPEPLMEGFYVKDLVSQVRALEAAEWKVKCVFGDVSPLGKTGCGDESGYKFYEQSDYFSTPIFNVDLLDKAGELYDLMGIDLWSLRKTKGFSKRLLNKAGDGCHIRALILHPDNPCFDHLMNFDIPEIRRDVALHEIKTMYEYFSEIAEKSQNIEVRRIRRGCPHFKLVKNDSTALCILYMLSQKFAVRPMWQCNEGTALYKQTSEEFDMLWQMNA